MPEVIEVPTEKKPMSATLAVIVSIAIGGGVGFYSSQGASDAALADQIAGAKHEIVNEIAVPEAVHVIDTLGTLDTLPAHIAPIMAKYAPTVVTGAQDTFIVTVTKKTNGVDSMAYYGVLCPPAGRTAVVKATFLDL